MKPFTFIDLFAGIGGIRIAFEKSGGVCVFSSEIDKYAKDTYEANFHERPFGDITKIDPSEIPDHTILLGGFPCQTFSICGSRKGFRSAEGTLFFSICKILDEKRPYALMLENVKNLKSHDGGRTISKIMAMLRDLGYNARYDILNALDFGLPQKRERTIIVGFRDSALFEFPEHCENTGRLEDILEDVIPDKYFLSNDIRRKRFEKVKPGYPTPSIWHENKSGNISALPYSCALRAGASHNYLSVNGIRRLTPRELLRLQGFPDNFKIIVSDAQIRKQAGNSVSIPVIAAVAKNMVKTMKESASPQQHDGPGPKDASPQCSPATIPPDPDHPNHDTMTDRPPLAHEGTPTQ